MNKLILGDNLEIMRKMESGTIDLIYLDPPFFSNRNYEVLWGDEGEIRSFQDRWSGGVDHYIGWLKERVAEMHRLLKPTGSIYLHCDWHADAYIRVHILDKIFGDKNFINAIDWCYNVGGKSKNHFARKKDTIFWYSKGKEWIFNAKYIGIKRDTGTKSMGGKIGVDENGRPYQDKIVKKTGKVYRYFLDEDKIPEDWWIDINSIQSQSKERIGYPTQKPEKLLERIISASSNENDLIFDPFVGGGTTIAVAERLNRKWIGIDQSVQAVKVTEFRVNILQNKDIYEKGNLFAQPFVVQLYKYDYDELFNRNPMQFESWIIEQFGGIANTKQKSDLGIDGKTRENIPIQVKQSENIGRNVIDNFNSAIKRFDKNLYDNNIQNNKISGYVIAFSFGKGAIQEVARLKNDENVIIQLVRVDEIVPISVKPTLTVEIADKGQTDKHLREIYFIATGETTEEKHIEFYAWDFNYNDKQFSAEILRDTQGKQVKTFKAGEYKIAVKVIDNEGLENTEIIKLKVNGKIEKL